MRRSKLVLFVHLVWATWDRLPLITPQIERRLYRCVEAEAIRQGCTVLALNGAEDHLHVLVSLPSTISIADLVKQLKGVSSRFVNEVLQPECSFKWQGSYGAFSVSAADVDRVRTYVQQQKEHHRTEQMWFELEACEEK
jgi:REP element-mobilizing transposase RayT